jgi:hypothetical protein
MDLIILHKMRHSIFCNWLLYLVLLSNNVILIMCSASLFCWVHEIEANDFFGDASLSMVGILILNLLD